MDEDSEIKAMMVISQALSSLDEKGIARVLRWAVDKYRMTLGPPPSEGRETEERVANIMTDDISTFFDCAAPTTQAERVLVIGYWLQERKGQRFVVAQGINDELKQLGHGVKNITDVLTSLMNQNPRLVIQIQKSGSTKQGRKRYRLTHEGIRRVDAMLARRLAEGGLGQDEGAVRNG